MTHAVSVTCPTCRGGDSLPLSGGWRRCWTCGRRWGPEGTKDPGDPPWLAKVAAARQSLHRAAGRRRNR